MKIKKIAVITLLSCQTLLPGFTTSPSILHPYGVISEMQKTRNFVNETARKLQQTVQRYESQQMTIQLIERTLKNNTAINVDLGQLDNFLQKISTVTTDNKRHHKRLNAMAKKVEMLKGANDTLLDKLHKESIPFLSTNSNIQG